MFMKLVFTLFVFCLSLQSVFAYSGGDGSEDAPYQISNVTDLEILMYDYENWNKYFILTSDIDGNTITAPKPIGNEEKHFTGVFNGDGYTISNISYDVDSTDFIGFFGYIDGSDNPGVEAIISDLTLENFFVRGKQKVGVFAGTIKFSTITNCNVSGEVLADEWYAGGFAAVNEESSIIDCMASCDVTGVSHVGGFIADNLAGVLTNCIATGHVNFSYSGDTENDGWFVGSFIGWSKESTISNCSANGNATGRLNVGGFVGFSDSCVISFCSASGDATGLFRIGGFIGDQIAGSDIQYCSSSGNISGLYNLGGFVGQSDGTIIACYSLGDVISLEDETDFCLVGGFIGTIYENGNIEECYSMGDAVCNSISIEGAAIGGFIGNHMGSITNCSSSGNAIDNVNEDNGFIGSFAGYDYQGTTSNCFSFGNASSEKPNIIGGFVGATEEASYNCCFWNKTANPDYEDAGSSDDPGDEISSLTEDQFYQHSSFSCFDFVDIWCMAEGESFPHLQKIVDCDSLTSVEEYSTYNKINIHPNPATDYIEIPETYSNVAIYSILGIKMMEINNAATRINISRLPAGIYYISINGRFEKLVKM